MTDRQSPPPASMREAWTIAFASMLLMMVGTGGHYLVVVGLKPIAADMEWPRSIPSSAYALTLFGMGLGGIVMGRWSDRVGVAKPALLGGIMLGVGAFVASQAQHAWVLLFANGVIIGFLGNGALFTPLIANTTRWFTRHRGIAVGVVSAGQSLGGALWPPIHRYTIETGGWRAAYMIYGLVAVMICIPWALVLKRDPPAPEAMAAATGASVPRVEANCLGFTPLTLQVLLCFAIVGCCIAMSMPMVHVVSHASDLGHPAARAAEVLAILLLTAFFSRLLWGALSDRIGGLRTLLISSSCQALMLVVFLFAESLPALYLTAAFYGLAYGGIVPTYSVVIREHFPFDQIGRRMGVVYFFGTVGMALGGTVGGFVFDLAGNYSTAFAVGIAFNIGNLCIVGPLVWRERRRILEATRASSTAERPSPRTARNYATATSPK